LYTVLFALRCQPSVGPALPRRHRKSTEVSERFITPCTITTWVRISRRPPTMWPAMISSSTAHARNRRRRGHVPYRSVSREITHGMSVTADGQCQAARPRQQRTEGERTSASVNPLKHEAALDQAGHRIKEILMAGLGTKASSAACRGPSLSFAHRATSEPLQVTPHQHDTQLTEPDPAG